MLNMNRYVRVALVLAACEILVLALIFMGLWRLGDVADTNAELVGIQVASTDRAPHGCCILRCENAGEHSADDRDPTVTPTPAACQVDTATPVQQVTGTDTPYQPTPQETPTPVPTLGPTPTIPTATPTPVGTDPTPSPVPSSTPKPEPTATDTPASTKAPKCNRGLGNGSEGCDPGNSGGKPGGAGEGNE